MYDVTALGWEKGINDFVTTILRAKKREDRMISVGAKKLSKKSRRHLWMTP